MTPSASVGPSTLVVSSRPSPKPSEAPSPSPTPTLAPLTFVSTGSMEVPLGPAGTLLPNGKVLFGGGASFANFYVATYFASVELYDPASGEFNPTGSLPRPASYATATLLRDGLVLLAGGATCKDTRRCTDVQTSTGIEPLSVAELYDPSTGKFTQTGSLITARYDATATLLPDGRVLIAGGAPYAELYVPATGKFVRTGKETAIDGEITATLLQDGRVLVTGEDPQGDSLAQLYDETSGKFTTISLVLQSGTPSAKYEGVTIDRQDPETATLLKDGRVLLFEGGYLETYDPARGVCADAGFISPAGQWFASAATLLPDGSVLFEGGAVNDPVSQQQTTTNLAVVYDPIGGTVRTSLMHDPRDGQTATLLPDGSVLIAGGEDSDGKGLTSAELFKP
jgi:hypothetical protein